MAKAKRETFDQLLKRKGAEDPLTVRSINALVGGNLAGARALRGLTQEKLGQLLEPVTGKSWSKATISALERSAEGGRTREFDADDLVALAKVLEVPILFLFLPPSPDYHPNDRWVARSVTDDAPATDSDAVMDAAELMSVLIGTGDSSTAVGAGDATSLIRQRIDELLGFLDDELTPLVADVKAERIAQWRATLEDIAIALQGTGKRS